MVYKIVFFDIDGTLIDSSKQIQKETVNAIEKLQKNDVKVVLATGRSPIHIKDVRDALNINSYICFNGSSVFYEGEKLHGTCIERENVRKLVDDANMKNHPLIFLTEEGCYSSKEIDSQIKASFDFLKEELPEYNSEVWKKEGTYQIYLYCEAHEQQYYEKNHPNLKLTRWHKYAMDVNVKNINKSEGIKWLLNYLQINPKEAVAFGDNLNDLEMMLYVGMGIAMGNAVEETKKKADFVTKHINDNGISYALKKLNLI